MIFLHATWFLILFLLLLKSISVSGFFAHRRVHPVLFQLMFILKVCAGIVMTFIYSQFYTQRNTADIFKYFDDSGVMWQAIHDGHPAHFAKMITGIDSQNPELDVYYRQMISWDEREALYNDSRIIIRCNALLRFVSAGNYYIHMLAMCYITLVALTMLFHAIATLLEEKFMLIFFSVFCLPSVVFWYSGMLKDGILIAALSTFIYGLFVHNKPDERILKIPLLILSFIVLLFLKTYILLIVLPGLFLLKMLNENNSLIKSTAIWITTYSIWIMTLFCIGLIFPKFNFVDMMILKQQNFFQLAQQMKAGSYFEIAPIHSVKDLIINAPAAFYNVMLRPFITDNRSPVVLIAAIENLLILGIAVYAIINKQKIPTKQNNIFLFCGAFSLLLFILIGLIVPVAGAIVRYKVTALPFFVLLFVILVDKVKAKAHLRSLRIIK